MGSGEPTSPGVTVDGVSTVAVVRGVHGVLCDCRILMIFSFELRISLVRTTVTQRKFIGTVMIRQRRRVPPPPQRR